MMLAHLAADVGEDLGAWRLWLWNSARLRRLNCAAAISMTLPLYNLFFVCVSSCDSNLFWRTPTKPPERFTARTHGNADLKAMRSTPTRAADSSGEAEQALRASVS